MEKNFELFLGYVRSTIDHTLFLYEKLEEHVDRVQNPTVKLICGGMQITPIAAYKIDTNIVPSDLLTCKGKYLFYKG